jgi:hypothetical protein
MGRPSFVRRESGLSVAGLSSVRAPVSPVIDCDAQPTTHNPRTAIRKTVPDQRRATIEKGERVADTKNLPFGCVRGLLRRTEKKVCHFHSVVEAG